MSNKTKEKNIDVKEGFLHRSGSLLNILLIDRTTRKNIIWGTDSYVNNGNDFLPTSIIKPELVTEMYNLLIQPRAAKSLEEQRRRTKDKAEVFTPIKTVDQMNRSLESFQPNKNNWQEYVRQIKLEITCGEAPFIVTRYNPVAHGVLIKVGSRVGFLDRKMKVVSKFCDNKSDWIDWSKEAFKSSYGYEWQGDNLLIARENLLYTFIDYYEDKFGEKPSINCQEEIAEIISWNIFQMDGLRYVVPMTCFHEIEVIPGQFRLFERHQQKLDVIEEFECEGCIYNKAHKHNGLYAKVMDWEKAKVIRFVDLINT